MLPCSAERAGPAPWCEGWDGSPVPVPIPVPILVPIQPCRTAGGREAPPGPLHFIAFILTPFSMARRVPAMVRCRLQEPLSKPHIPPPAPPARPLPLDTVFKTFNIKVSSLFSILRNISSVYGALAVNKAPQAPSPRRPGAGVPGCGAGRGAEEVAPCSPGGWWGHPSGTPPPMAHRSPLGANPPGWEWPRCQQAAPRGDKGGKKCPWGAQMSLGGDIQVQPWRCHRRHCLLLSAPVPSRALLVIKKN